MKWTQKNDWHWARECGKYTVSRALMWDKNPNGEWRYLAHYKPDARAESEVISSESRATLDAAIEDCAAHIRAQQQHDKSTATGEQHA